MRESYTRTAYVVNGGLVARIDGLLLKVERAKEHIRDLDANIRAFCKSKPYTIGSKPHPVAAIEHTTIYVASVKPVPATIALISGDAAHNLRSSLDHLVWQLVEANGGIPTRKNYFPISDSPKQYTSALKSGVVDGISPGAKKLIDGVQCHVTGDNTLTLLHEIDIIDKHRLLITAVSSMDKWGVDVMKGQTIWFDEGWFVSLEAGYEIANIPTSTFERQQHQDFQLAVDVAFGKPEVAEGYLVFETLKKTAEFIERLIRKFERFLV